MVKRQDYIDYENVKKMYENQDIDAFIQYIKCAMKKEYNSDIQDMINDLIKEFALNVANNEKEYDYWHELWDYERNDEAHDMIMNYERIVDDYNEKIWEAKEKEIIKEKGKFDKMVEFVVFGSVSRNKYANETIDEIKDEVRSELRVNGSELKLRTVCKEPPRRGLTNG